MRLVDADWLKSVMLDEPTEWMTKEQFVQFRAMIDLAPTVDAVPVVHGHWKEDTGGYSFWICSHCGFVSEASAADLLYRYCPHCGARMDGKDGDGNG